MRRSAGFTLIEAVIGIALLGLIVAALTAGTRYALKVEQIQTRLLTRTGDLDGVDRILRQLIAQASPGAANTMPVHGAKDRIMFTTVLPDPGGGMAVHADVMLVLNVGGHLVLRWQPHGSGGKGREPHDVELLDGVAGLEVTYLGATWRDQWESSDQPTMIRIRIAFPDGDARHWPDIVIAPMRTRPR